jgi:hypothetical protein
LGKNLPLAKIEGKLMLLKRNGILSVVYFLIGQPFDTIDTIIYNIRYSRTLHATFVEFTPYVDFNEVELKGRGDSRERIPPAQIRRLGKRGEMLFYFRPKKILELSVIIARSILCNVNHVPRLLFNAAHYLIRMVTK